MRTYLEQNMKIKPLFVPLKTEYFRAFETGAKRTEFRLYGARWNERTVVVGRQVVLSHGYSGKRLSAKVRALRKITNTISGIYPIGATLAAIDLDF